MPVYLDAVRLFRNLDDLPDRFCHGAVAIGKFDGVHLGHVRIIERLLRVAHSLSCPPLVFTFDPLPAQILRPQHAPAPLCWIERKADLLAELGAEAVLAYPTEESFLRTEASDFFQQILRGRLDARAIVEGPNFVFGHNRMGTVERLRQFCREAGILLEVVDPVRVKGRIVSSSQVRALIAAGRIAEVTAMLSRPYRIRGTVIRGVGRGMRLGYPTVNIGQVDTLLPGEGIYAGRLWTGGGSWPAAVSIGPNPTFDEMMQKVEAHLVGFQGSLYDCSVELDFYSRLRDIRRFDSAEQLIAQMDRDVAATMQFSEPRDAS